VSPVLFLKNLLFTLLVPGTVAVVVPWMIGSAGSDASGSSSAAHRTLSLAPMAAGVCIYLWCLWDFATFGRGTPAPIDAPKRLVVRGLYHHVRNPMYVGVLFAILGWALYFSSARLLLYAAAVGAAFHLFVVVYEEPALRSHFGADYERYCSRVRRWLPGLPRGQGD
jgi:protein-S-isoprenylcysteine O-methyltransferase Ste14